MNKYLLISALCVGASLVSSAQAYDGQVNFKGTILDTACTVDINSKNLDVNLGRVAKTVFTSVGDVSTAMPFSLKLTGCPAAVTTDGAKIRFEGTTVAGKTDVLDLASGSVATGVGVQIKDNAGQKIVFGSDSSKYPLSEGANSLDFTAYYISTNTAIVSGSANAVANFTVVYP
ncbi:ferrous iron transporter B [Leminorella grimontii]|uniref:Ferrous iron transporter B n=1 Tax=Leminorella grimontii TaxID=82981 RepID=A0AAV5N3Z9_9GAMM|nr:fimbrial protein [Leminorella grimontii]KFC94868.1 type-1 fimbrial protein [Leminorella grimontii ATCC 33999 = DSM 5078]GKX56833.1 ferrous iron transporter B [Leminorella grimontii]VFS61015.1 S-fimbrillin [Leminorella grimontii]